MISVNKNYQTLFSLFIYLLVYSSVSFCFGDFINNYDVNLLLYLVNDVMWRLVTIRQVAPLYFAYC